MASAAALWMCGECGPRPPTLSHRCLSVIWLLRTKTILQSGGLAVDMSAWREQTCHVGLREALAVVWQLKKQEHGSPVLAQQEGAGNREDTASGFPPLPAPVHDF